METENEVSETDSGCIPMLDFERQMFLDMLESDALLITGKGLNSNVVVMNLLRSHMDPSNLVLVVNSSDAEEKYFMEKLDIPPLPNTSNEREKVYMGGKVHFVSTRILVVDLLKNRVPIEQISGIVVLRAHTVLESCQEAFALRLYRQRNKTGFIKAFSNSPISFTFGFAHVEKIMRALFITELFLWPRFHSLVNQSLKRRTPNVIELHVPLSQKCTMMQTCILDIMNYTTKELKKINRTLELQEITVDNCITKNFHKMLQTQLDCIWHQLSSRTKELIQDLKIMRELMMHLIHRDSVTFYSLLSKYRTPEYAKVNSGWILLDSAEQLFKIARTRVFNDKQEFSPEINQKWKYLNEILSVEIPNDRKKFKVYDKCVKILILCNDTKTCSQLNEYLMLGEARYFQITALRKNLRISHSTESVSGESNLSGSSNNKNDLPDKDDDLEEDFDKTNYILTMTQNIIDNMSQNKSTQSCNESQFEPFTQMEEMNLTQIETDSPLVYIQPFKYCFNNGICLEDTLKLVQPHYIVMYHSDVTATRQIELYSARRNENNHPLTVYFLIHAQTTEEQSYLTSLRREKEAFELLIETKSTMVIPSYQDGKSELETVENEVHDTEETNTRKAGGQSNENSKEKHRVIVDMREFRSDLPALLHKKGITIDPVTIAIGDYILTPEICVERKSLSDLIGSLNSGRLYTQCTQMCRNYTRPILLIEFDQNKPFQLQVDRNNDLFLVCGFNPPLHIQGHYTLSNDMSGNDIRQKLQLLTIHFPKLKLVWSPSPYATAELFFELKQGRTQPSSETALALGDETSGDGLAIERYNPNVHDFLLKLPGINSKNIARIMNTGKSLENIVRMTKEEIQEIVGNRSDGEMLWNVLHNTYKPQDSLSQTKPPLKNRFGKPMRGKRR